MIEQPQSQSQAGEYERELPDLGEPESEAADLSGADLRACDLSGAELSDAKLGGAKMADGVGNNPAILGGAHMSGVVTTSISQSSLEGSYLDLLAAEGLEDVRFQDSEFLGRYIESAFEYAHRTNTSEARNSPKFLEKALARIKTLRSLATSPDVPPVLVEAIRAISAELIEHLAKHPHEMHNLGPRQFEELIAEVLSSYGWQVQLTPPMKDGGYDIYAIAPVAGGIKTSYIIECKKWKDNVDVTVANALYGVKTNLGVSNALLVTTADVTRGVNKRYASRWKLQTAGFHQIATWLNEYHPLPNGDIYYREHSGLILPRDPDDPTHG